MLRRFYGLTKEEEADMLLPADLKENVEAIHEAVVVLRRYL
jgi:hypothetical protein